MQHARTREQFGRPIGDFQAVRHLCADPPVRTRTARGRRPRGGRHRRPGRRPHRAAARRRAAARGARDRLRVRGGMGSTWEFEVHPHLKRARVPAPTVPGSLRNVRSWWRPYCPQKKSEWPWTARSRKRAAMMSRIVAHRNHGALISPCVRSVTRHGAESGVRSGTLCGMRVVPSTSHAGAAFEAASYPAVLAAARPAYGLFAPACSTLHGKRRTVCNRGNPSRWNMPEALVGVTVRQPCCQSRDSRSVTLALAIVLAMKKMARIVALVRRGVKCPPVRMV